MKQPAMLTEVLSDLVKINHDRVQGYEKAIEATNDADMQALFQGMIDESKHYAAQLNEQLVAMGERTVSAITAPGKLFKTWMDMKCNFMGYDRHAILSCCEYGEDAAQAVYSMVLKSDTPMPYYLRELIGGQQAALKDSHDTIKTYRDVENVSH
ncbi:PA2169 family four-helix-bundle protein [Chitinophaga sp. MM2321]|uniref:PA2169 family four-helix-bundle protein n=1 Tax=Chitinophaga sp. MM2321 TaxID=3137178 RepID=UPI0032D5AF87